MGRVPRREGFWVKAKKERAFCFGFANGKESMGDEGTNELIGTGVLSLTFVVDCLVYPLFVGHILSMYRTMGMRLRRLREKSASRKYLFILDPDTTVEVFFFGS